MRIGIDAFSLIPGEGKGAGGQVYLQSLIENLLRIDAHNQYFVFVNKFLKFKCEGRNLKVLKIGLDSRKKYLRPIFENILLPFLVRKNSIDIIHSPLNNCPITPFGRCKKVVTVHDMICFFRREMWPEYSSFIDRLRRRALPIMLRKADRIIAVSYFTKMEILKYCRLDPARISVIHEGPGFCVSSRDEARFNQRNYFLTVASDSPQKNLVNYIKAISLLPQEVLEIYKFLICGMIRDTSTGMHMGKDKLKNLINEKKMEKNIIIEGYLPDEALLARYREAFAIVYPSLYEGFGLPVLEAFHFQKPLLCSKAGSLNEVGGQGALYFDPNDPNDIADKIKLIVCDRYLQNKMVVAGKKRLLEFSWERCALKTIEFYRSCLTR